MVLHKYGNILYNNLGDVVTAHLTNVGKEIQEQTNEDFLVALNSAWNDHKLSMGMIRDILMYLVCAFILL